VVRFTSTDIYRIVGGKIVEVWTELDALGTLEFGDRRDHLAPHHFDGRDLVLAHHPTEYGLGVHACEAGL
jgi:hypothetical protein